MRGFLNRLLRTGRVARFDLSVARLAGSARGNALVDRSMYLASEAANHSILWHSINLVDAVLCGPGHRSSAVRRSVILATEQALVNGPVKMLASRDRPADSPDHGYRLRIPRTSSFPSGHASAAACAATLLSRDLGHRPIWWSAAAIVSWSRVHVGVHHGSDIAAGLVAGGSLALLADGLWSRATARQVRASARNAG